MTETESNAHPTGAGDAPRPTAMRSGGAHPTHDAGLLEPSAGPRWPTILLLAIAALMGVDMLEDATGDDSLGHLAREGVVLLLSVGGAVVLLLRAQRLARDAAAVRDEARGLARDLRRAHADAARWRDEAEHALAGLGAAIDAQFLRWALTPAEREVGLLLLKGLSLKEIATLRGASERTVRQQAAAIYKKADVAGRAELSAFFLEDLLLPKSGGELGAEPERTQGGSG